MYVRNSGDSATADEYMAFPTLLSELTAFTEAKGELVFIPVNDPDRH
jgi:hypothetical protein